MSDDEPFLETEPKEDALLRVMREVQEDAERFSTQYRPWLIVQLVIILLMASDLLFQIL